MLRRFFLLFLITASATVGLHKTPGNSHQPKLTPQNSGTTQLLIAVSPVNSRVVWAAGNGRHVCASRRTAESTWKAGVVPGAESSAVP